MEFAEMRNIIAHLNIPQEYNLLGKVGLHSLTRVRNCLGVTYWEERTCCTPASMPISLDTEHDVVDVRVTGKDVQGCLFSSSDLPNYDAGSWHNEYLPMVRITRNNDTHNGDCNIQVNVSEVLQQNRPIAINGIGFSSKETENMKYSEEVGAGTEMKQTGQLVHIHREGQEVTIESVEKLLPWIECSLQLGEGDNMDNIAHWFLNEIRGEVNNRQLMQERAKSIVKQVYNHYGILRLGLGELIQEVVPSKDPVREAPWVHLNFQMFDITSIHDFQRVLGKENSVDRMKSEHVFEHINLAQAIVAATNCYLYLKPGASIRIAVPDYNWYVFTRHRGIPSNELEVVNFTDDDQLIRVNHSDCFFGEEMLQTDVLFEDLRDGHYVQYTLNSLSAMLESVGFEVHAVEFTDCTGRVFVRDGWSEAEDGPIQRSTKQEVVDGKGSWSLIVDAIKPLQPQKRRIREGKDGTITAVGFEAEKYKTMLPLANDGQISMESDIGDDVPRSESKAVLILPSTSTRCEQGAALNVRYESVWDSALQFLQRDLRDIGMDLTLASASCTEEIASNVCVVDEDAFSPVVFQSSQGLSFPVQSLQCAIGANSDSLATRVGAAHHFSQELSANGTLIVNSCEDLAYATPHNLRNWSLVLVLLPESASADYSKCFDALASFSSGSAPRKLTLVTVSRILADRFQQEYSHYDQYISHHVSSSGSGLPSMNIALSQIGYRLTDVFKEADVDLMRTRKNLAAAFSEDSTMEYSPYIVVHHDRGPSSGFLSSVLPAIVNVQGSVEGRGVVVLGLGGPNLNAEERDIVDRLKVRWVHVADVSSAETRSVLYSGALAYVHVPDANSSPVYASSVIEAAGAGCPVVVSLHPMLIEILEGARSASDGEPPLNNSTTKDELHDLIHPVSTNKLTSLQSVLEALLRDGYGGLSHLHGLKGVEGSVADGGVHVQTPESGPYFPPDVNEKRYRLSQWAADRFGGWYPLIKTIQAAST